MPSHRLLTAGACALMLASAFGVEARAAGSYPRVGLYGSVLGGGFPYVKPDLTLDTLEIARAARFHEIVLDVYPISPYRPDIVQAMHARNPAAHVLAYVLATNIWQSEDADSANHIPTLIRHRVRDLNGFLYDANTGAEYPDMNINIAKRGTNGRFVVAEALADIFRDHVIATGIWDGIFTDVFCQQAMWTQAGTGRVIDLARAGYASGAQLDAAWSEACDTLAARLRRDGGPTFTLVGNCAASDQHDRYHGWMRENFPYQQGGTWKSNMLGNVSARGYLKDDRDYLQPPHNWILSNGPLIPDSQYDALNTHKVRYGVASAALGEGVHAYCPTKNVRDSPYQDWWYDEYAVDLATGASSEAQQHTGWLGQALGPASMMVWAGSGPDAITNPGFETDVTSGWQFVWFSPATATFTRDAATAAVGNASAKVHVGTASRVEWHVYINSLGRLNVSAGSSYSATFWCKASAPRTLQVRAGDSGGQAYVTVDTTWRQYQAVLQPGVSMNVPLTFWLGTQAGDVWFDDVHFQAGVSSVWRRDFQNGIVLLNPTELSLDVALEAPYRRLLGAHAPGINDGGLSASLRMPPYDALFLLRAEIDNTPPAAIQDVRVGP